MSLKDWFRISDFKKKISCTSLCQRILSSSLRFSNLSNPASTWGDFLFQVPVLVSLIIWNDLTLKVCCFPALTGPYPAHLKLKLIEHWSGYLPCCWPNTNHILNQFVNCHRSKTVVLSGIYHCRGKTLFLKQQPKNKNRSIPILSINQQPTFNFWL